MILEKVLILLPQLQLQTKREKRTLYNVKMMRQVFPVTILPKLILSERLLPVRLLPARLFALVATTGKFQRVRRSGWNSDMIGHYMILDSLFVNVHFTPLLLAKVMSILHFDYGISISVLFLQKCCFLATFHLSPLSFNLKILVI